MLDTRESAISGLVDSFSSLGNEHSPKDLKLYQNSVAQELRRLITNYRCIWDGIRNRPDPLTLFNKVNTRTELLDALKSKSLPTLRSQVISLYNALENPCDHQSKPRKKLKKVMKILSNLETTLEEIKFATACIIPDLDPHELSKRDGNPIDKINNSLKQFLEFIHQQDRLTKEQSISVGQEVGDQSLSKGTISAIATLKLTRLFLAKLLKLSTDKENFSMVTNLSSRELNSFARVTTTLSISIEKVVNAICGSVDNEMNDALLIQKSASNILAAPKLLFNMIEYVFVPVVHQVDQPSPKIYYRAWFYQWNSVHHSIALSFGDALGFTFI
ncbi:hypothetical protein KEM48_007517 [Puccinia striiformis f. sp. tritici PST-130]|nr:hypothetical protein KEM48_007517 [Puccinia striiformis f. sp. tritici PST-130]